MLIRIKRSKRINNERKKDTGPEKNNKSIRSLPTRKTKTKKERAKNPQKGIKRASGGEGRQRECKTKIHIQLLAQ